MSPGLPWLKEIRRIFWRLMETMDTAARCLQMRPLPNQLIGHHVLFFAVAEPGYQWDCYSFFGSFPTYKAVRLEELWWEWRASQEFGKPQRSDSELFPQDGTENHPAEAWVHREEKCKNVGFLYPWWYPSHPWWIHHIHGHILYDYLL